MFKKINLIHEYKENICHRIKKKKNEDANLRIRYCMIKLSSRNRFQVSIGEGWLYYMIA